MTVEKRNELANGPRLGHLYAKEGMSLNFFARAASLDRIGVSDCAALKGRQKLSVKAVVSALDTVVRSRRLHIAHQIFAEVPFEQPCANLFAGGGHIERDGDVRVEGSERLVV